MGPQHLSPMQLLCLLGAISSLPWAEALLCYEATSSLFRAVGLHRWQWFLLRSMVCKLNEGCEETLVFIEAGTRKGILGFKGCSPASSYPPQVSYLVSPPGLSIASYSRVCRTYLCNNLTNMNAILHLKARTPKTLKSSSHSCPTCVGEHSKSCLPNFVSSESCPRDATKCYSSTVKFQAGFLNTTFLLMGCAREHTSVLAHFHHIGSIRVTEVINIVEKALFTGAGTPCRSPSWGILLGLLFAFKG
ncbi:ly6/PLAUR domain-containing protein 4 [Bos mutus]|uniref:Ly6/PLAUR domain-containing protein 4 n=1 Tax=Bos mutus TaxID=72004 RepID=L8HS29_9CETA|nr:PREDICTED: ly6/PLAUR domain-containing protein 4 [Bos mutus]XP_006039933.3 ly6/PLAUR domain-containing protein 4 isoform X2 [Bubalus bubalis]XP_061244459.1 ly6/PLAUR domain-containing protein 4 isoform X4 [Bos javanicus]XP_061244460.1 ly6/PLAUR domain-containing protein 4 isoform X4 [Bos javanicus]XP_061244462.1 ly6/PLAUR domain-containing protein 4 isoform X4 [Bos javanicus]XP_061244463.1 ly6/PLAUR domain-containing protein 4 isoform X4 [Bos javanicus]XP_061244464.1 ly6/PLAUR domain-conta